MAISIKDEKTDRLARELARRTGESLTQTIQTALQERLQRLTGRRHADTVREKLYDILARVDRLPIRDRRSEDEILGYNEDGVPS
jgi:antitoxin VapB